MKMPGFTAGATLYKTSGHYQSVATRGYSRGEQRVISQIRVGGIGVGGIGGQMLGFWCDLGCAGIASLCIAACVYAQNPLCVAACIAAELKCLSGCYAVLRPLRSKNL